MTYTIYHGYTDEELLRLVAEATDASPLTVELALRLEKKLRPEAEEE